MDNTGIFVIIVFPLVDFTTLTVARTFFASLDVHPPPAKHTGLHMLIIKLKGEIPEPTEETFPLLSIFPRMRRGV